MLKYTRRYTHHLPSKLFWRMAQILQLEHKERGTRAKPVLRSLPCAPSPTLVWQWGLLSGSSCNEHPGRQQQQRADSKRRPYLLHKIQHHLKTSLLSGLTVCGGLCLKLLTYFAHYTMLFLIFFKLLWR